jgi:hypothetical protein
MRRDWWAPLTGIAFVAVIIISFAVGGEPPDADEPVQEIVDHYVDDKDAIMVGAGLSLLAAVLFVFFGSVLRQALDRSAGGESLLPRVAFAGTVIIAAGAGVDASLTFALAESAGDVDPAATQALQAAWDHDFGPFAIGQGLLFWGAGLAIVRYRALPVWLGWLAILFGISSVTPAGFFAFLGGAVWVIIVSVVLTLRNRKEPAAAAPPPA